MNREPARDCYDPPDNWEEVCEDPRGWRRLQEFYGEETPAQPTGNLRRLANDRFTRPQRSIDIGPEPDPSPTVMSNILINDLLELAGMCPQSTNFAADALVSLPRRFPRCHAGRQLCDQYYALQGRLIARGNLRPAPGGTMLLFWETCPGNTLLNHTRYWAGRFGKTIAREFAVALTPDEIFAFYETFPLLMRNSGFEPLNHDEFFGEEIPW